ncbi:MAG: hypothetical protein MR782_03390 [Campylobacter sp.]|uniref:hypothetical protein n=1 Tax=Campylobacter sp. TaxID=205 RepID=UPI002AA6D4FD|nr:hypothetical protein [Campylobacter sp.]MCI6339887.1 hypothetical protein [Campylobacter sp.]MCI7023346.1 hypothetical protein [Campylobacter sp.]
MRCVCSYFSSLTIKELRDAIHNGAKILKIDDYKHLTQRNINFYTELHGVKFI